jgi:hypothetical protein
MLLEDRRDSLTYRVNQRGDKQMKPVFLLVESEAKKATFLNVAKIEEIHQGDLPDKSIVYLEGDRDRGTYLVVNASVVGILDALTAVCDVVIPTQTKQPSGITG